MAPRTTMIATAATVRIVLLTNARTMRKSRVLRTVTRLSKNAQWVGQLNFSAAASFWVLPAVRTMKANGTRNTKTAMMSATDPPTHRHTRLVTTGLLYGSATTTA